MIVESITSALHDSGRLIFFTFTAFTIVRDEIGVLHSAQNLCYLK